MAWAGTMPAIGDRKIGQQEQHAGDDRGEAGPAALGDARGALDVGRVGADAGRGRRRSPRRCRRAGRARRRARSRPVSARPASAAMPVTVPIVSKKSDSMIAKIVEHGRRATPSLVNAWNGSCRPRPRVSKLTVAIRGSGIVATPATMATTVVTRMLMIRAARIVQGPQGERDDQPEQEHELRRRWSGRPGPTMRRPPPAGVTIRPPLAKPMNRMKRPMPTPIDRLRASGTAFMIASRAPSTTRTVMATPSSTMTPIAPAGVRPLAGRLNATMALMPRPAARANG